MKLYYAKGACSLAVRIVIHEMNLPCEFEAVNLGTKQTETGKDFYQINPKGIVPTLVLDNNEILTENTVIQQYLADKHKATHLLPPVSDFKRYRVLEMLSFINSDLHKSCSPLFNSAIPQTLKDEIFIPNLKKKLAFVEWQLKQNNFQKYLLGESFTLPDAYLFVILTWLPKLKVEIQEWPNLQRYFNDLKKMSIVIQALKEEGLKL